MCRDCDLITAGELFGRSGYGVGLQKGSPWADKVTLAILDYHESKQPPACRLELLTINWQSCTITEKALVGVLSVIVKTGCGTDGALHSTTAYSRGSRGWRG